MALKPYPRIESRRGATPTSERFVTARFPLGSPSCVFFYRRLLIAPLLLSFVGVLGCGADRSSDHGSSGAGSEVEEAAFPGVSAQAFLEGVLSRYRNSRSYSDRGEVVLTFSQNGQRVRRTSPMQVVMEGSSVYVAAYDARLWSDADKTIGWIANPETNFHDAQVVVGASASGDQIRPNLERLLSDPILTANLVGGLGGPPPQLEWLLDGNPMAKLFQPADDGERPAIEYERIEERDGQRCVVVKASVGEEVYRFSIGRDTSTIYHVDLPVSLVEDTIEFAGSSVRSLTLHLKDASFAGRGNEITLDEMPLAQLPARPRYVRSLIPLPPEKPPAMLGQTVARFSVRDSTGRTTVTERGAGKTVTLFLSVVLPELEASQRESTRAMLDQRVANLSAWFNQLPDALHLQLGVVLLVDEQSARNYSSGGGLLVRDDDRSIMRRFGIESGELALVDLHGRVVWVTAPINTTATDELSAIVGDVLRGVNVPEQVQRIWQADQQAYADKLSELTIDP